MRHHIEEHDVEIMIERATSGLQRQIHTLEAQYNQQEQDIRELKNQVEYLEFSVNKLEND